MTQLASRLLAAVASFAAVAFLQSCGSGAVSGPPTVNTGAVTVTPAAATLYAGLPSSFVINGGNGTYNVISNNQAIVPSIPGLRANTFTVLPQEVAADTAVVLTVQDVATSNAASSELTVKPRTISNTVTVTPSASQSSACGTSVCAGGDAEVRVVLSQAGVPIVGRNVRIDVLSGDARIIVSDAGGTETLGTTLTTVTDGTGTARVRVRVLNTAQAQTALLQATDLSSGFTQAFTVPIAPASNAPLTVQPTTIQFTGPDSTNCANNVSADVVVVGGRPPYQVTQAPGFLVNPSVLTFSGGRVTITATGQCATAANPQRVAIVDSLGASANVTIFNTTAPTAPTTAFAVSPTGVTLSSCGAIAQVALSGGTGTYFAASESNVVSATIPDNSRSIVSIQRQPGTPPTNPITVRVTDGQTVRAITVTLAQTAAGTCP